MTSRIFMKKFMTDVKEDPHLDLVRAHFIGRRYFIVWSSLGYEVLGLDRSRPPEI